MSRYHTMFERLERQRQGAFVPFVMLGDPDPETSLRIIDALIAGGADALELGFPFSDPIADGPVIQAAAIRALSQGVTPSDCFALLRQIRQKHADLPIGLLLYSNLVLSPGIDNFFATARHCGVDSVLVADIPIRESLAIRQAGQRHQVANIFIAPPNASDTTLHDVARYSQGYTYLLSRAGVTGADDRLQLPAHALIAKLKAAAAPPPLLGFGIASPEHVHQALKAGAAGAICGSAIVDQIPRHQQEPALLSDKLRCFVARMKAATQLSD